MGFSPRKEFQIASAESTIPTFSKMFPWVTASPGIVEDTRLYIVSRQTNRGGYLDGCAM